MSYREAQREGRMVYVFDDGRYFYRRDKADAHAAKLRGLQGLAATIEWSSAAADATDVAQIGALTLRLPSATPLTTTPSLTVAETTLPLPPVWCGERATVDGSLEVRYVFSDQAREDVLTFTGEPRISVTCPGLLAVEALLSRPQTP